MFVAYWPVWITGRPARVAVGVRLVGVAGDDRVDVRVRALLDRAPGGLVHEQDHYVGLAVGLVAVGELVGVAVRGLDDRQDIQVDDAGRAHQRRKLLGHGTDETDADPVGLDDRVRRRLRRRLAGRLERNVRREVLPGGGGTVAVVTDDVVAQVGPALVELMVADRRDVQAGRAHRVDGWVVVLDERNERRGADQVAGTDEERVRVRGPDTRSPLRP